MGNIQARGARKFLDPEPVWQDYYAADWRSERAKDLDRYGGPARPPVARGESVTAKLIFLEAALRREQKRMKHVLQQDGNDKPKREEAQKASDRAQEFVLNTDIRAIERTNVEGPAPVDANAVQQQQRDFSVLTKDPEVRRKMMEQRKKMLEYAKSVNVVKGAPAIKPLNLPAIRSKVAANWRSEGDSLTGDYYFDDEFGEGGEAPDGSIIAFSGPSAQPAEWRLRVHQARRRTMLVVAAAARWQLALARRPGPKRLPRVSSFSYYIPAVLGDEAQRFIEEAIAVARIKAEVTKLEEQVLQQIEQERLQLQQQGEEGEETATTQQQQQQGAEVPTPRRAAARGPARRGASDSGCTASATAAALEGGAAGGGSAATISGSSGTVAGGEAQRRSPGARARKRPELLKSSSVALGHSSDADVPYSARRPMSSNRLGTRLPAIAGGGGGGSAAASGGSRASSSGQTAPGQILSATPPPDGTSSALSLGARLARAKAGRRVSSAGTARSGRRQSDSSITTGVPLPPGIAAAAAAGAALLAGSAGAATERRVVRGGGGGGGGGGGVGYPRAGVTDSGMARVARESNGVDGSVVVSVTAPGQQQGLMPLQGRRSETGGSITLGGGLAPESPGFLPPIAGGGGAAGCASGSGAAAGGAGSSGAAAGSGAVCSPSKTLALAQARRMGLLADGSNSPVGVVEEGARMSPRPPGLASHKLGNAACAGRSPDKIPLGSPAGAGSILDSLMRQSRDGGPAAALAAAAGLGVAASPLNSPGYRCGGIGGVGSSAGRTASLDTSPLRLATTSVSGGSSETINRAASDTGPGVLPQSARLAARPPPPLAVGVAISTSDPADGPPSPVYRHLPSPPSVPPPAYPGPGRPSLVGAPLSPPLGAGGSPCGPPPSSTAAAASQPPPPQQQPQQQQAPTGGKPPLPPGAVTTTAATTATSNPPPTSSSNTGVGSLERSRSGRSLDSLGINTASLEPEATARLVKAQQLMTMYANRVNAMWAEGQQWGAPSVLSASEQEAFCASDAWVPYKLNVLRLLKAGGLVVHIDACADAVQLQDGTSLDLWTSDPWTLVQKLRPGSLPLSERIEGVPLGARALQQLVLAVEALAGREAVGRLQVVLAINDDQRNAVVADIIRSRSYGLKPENLILTAQRKRCGYRYDREAQAFLEDPTTPALVLGSGYSLCQLAWLGDAFSVGEEGELKMLMGRTLLERFAEGRVEWLVARRARDLALLTPEGVLDLQHLAFAMYAADRHGGNVVLQAAAASSLTIPRAYDSTLLALKRTSTASSSNSSSSSSSSSSTTSTSTTSSNSFPFAGRAASMAAGAAGVEGGGGAAGVVDLRVAELSSPVMVEAVAGVRRQAGHEGWVGLQRAIMHVPTLHGLLNSLGIFRPKLAMSGDVARLSLDAGDITADPRVACVAVQARNSPAILTSPNEVDDLIPLLLAQDRSAAFRDILSQINAAANTGITPTFIPGLLSSYGPSGDASGPANITGGLGPGLGPVMGGFTVGSNGSVSMSGCAFGGAQIVSSPALLLASKPGIRILLFVAANDVTQLAVNLVLLMARPGRDVVHLVTVVHNSLVTTTGQALVLKYLKQISNAMIEAHAEVLVKGMCGLLEMMESAVERLSPGLVVLASSALTMSNLNTASVMGSVTLSVLKRLSLPVAVVTSNSRNLVLTQRRTALRCMAVVEATSRPALNFLCTSCMEPMRGDRLVLAGHHPTRQMTSQQQQTQRRLIDNFADIASSHRFHSASRLQLDGSLDRALSAAADEEGIHLVGMQLPLGSKGVPGHVLGLIRSCKGAVLVYRDPL